MAAKKDERSEKAERGAQVAWKPGTYARCIDKSRAWLYALPEALQPRSVKVGHSRLITEPPQRFLKRLAQHYAKAA